MDRGGPPQSATNEPSSPGEEALQPAGAPQPLCILAGSGTLPGEIADSVVGTGGTVHIVGLRGVASDDIARHPHSWTGLGQVARMLRLMRASGAGRLLIVGGLQRPNLWHLRPDLGFLAHFKTIAGIMRGGDDAVLRRVIRFFEAQGLEVVGVPDVAPEVVVGRDLSIGAAPTDSDPAGTPGPAPAIATATRLIRALADFDIGQGAIAVPEGVIGIEDGGGTARLIAGARGIGDREAVLVKMTKAGQETRVDLPTAGPDTIAQARTVGLSGIALEAGRSLIAERKRTMRDARAAGISIRGFAAGDDGALPRRTVGLPRDIDEREDAATSARIAVTAWPHLAVSRRSLGVFVRRQHAKVIVVDGLSNAMLAERIGTIAHQSSFGLVPRRLGAVTIVLDAGRNSRAQIAGLRALLPTLRERRIATLVILAAAPSPTVGTPLAASFEQALAAAVAPLPLTLHVHALSFDPDGRAIVT